MKFNERQYLEGENKASQGKQGQRFHFNWSLTFKTKSCTIYGIVHHNVCNMIYNLHIMHDVHGLAFEPARSR